jgi:hypothetical protein
VTTDQDMADDRQRLDALVGTDDIPGPVAAEFVALAASLMDATTVRGVLQRVVEAAKAVVPGADLVSVTLRSGGGFHTPVETDALATRLDEIQYRLDDGPCVAATRKSGLGLTFCSDLATSTRFGAFGPAAAQLGVHSVLAVGLFPDGDGPRMGALNVYSHVVGGLDELDRDLALVLAAHASAALAATLAATSAELEAAQLRQALQSRDVIGQAKGILMERRKISADEAFEVLRSASQSLNVKLAQVAQTLVERRADI